MTFEQLSPDEFEALLDDSESFYLSSVRFGEIEDVAAIMSRSGADDEDIGKIVRHHFHDRPKNNVGLRIYTLRHRERSEKFGLVVLIPNEVWYEKLHERIVAQIGDADFGQQLRFYETPDHEHVLKLATDEVIKRGDGDEGTYVLTDHASSIDTQIRSELSARTDDVYKWRGR